jgi:hypothetical protein
VLSEEVDIPPVLDPRKEWTTVGLLPGLEQRDERISKAAAVGKWALNHDVNRILASNHVPGAFKSLKRGIVLRQKPPEIRVDPQLQRREH